MTKKEKRDIRQEVTDKVVATIESMNDGDVNWIKSWFTVNDRPTSKSSGKPYQGINWFILSMVQSIEGYESNQWGTFNYWFKAGGGEREGKTVTKESRYSVKGQKGTQVVLYKPMTFTETDDTGKKVTKSFPLMKGFTVFNADQVEGYTVEPMDIVGKVDECEEPVVAVNNLMATLGIKLVHKDKNRAFYTPPIDTVNSPLPAQFDSAEAYACTNLHETGHATGHESRLNRDLKNHFGDQAYAFEELIAELFSAMMAGELGIAPTPREDHAHYLKGWLKRLKEDKFAIFRAVAAAQKAADWVHDATEEVSEEDTFAEAA